jgi:hypothetical protein
MVRIFIECLMNGTGFNDYYTTSTTRTSSGSHQPSQELKYTNQAKRFGIGCNCSFFRQYWLLLAMPST